MITVVTVDDEGVETGKMEYPDEADQYIIDLTLHLRDVHKGYIVYR